MKTTPLTTMHLVARVTKRFDLRAYPATRCSESAARTPLTYIAAQCITDVPSGEPGVIGDTGSDRKVVVLRRGRRRVVWAATIVLCVSIV